MARQRQASAEKPATVGKKEEAVATTAADSQLTEAVAKLEPAAKAETTPTAAVASATAVATAAIATAAEAAATAEKMVTVRAILAPEAAGSAAVIAGTEATLVVAAIALSPTAQVGLRSEGDEMMVATAVTRVGGISRKKSSWCRPMLL